MLRELPHASCRAGCYCSMPQDPTSKEGRILDIFVCSFPFVMFFSSFPGLDSFLLLILSWYILLFHRSAIYPMATGLRDWANMWTIIIIDHYNSNNSVGCCVVCDSLRFPLQVLHVIVVCKSVSDRPTAAAKNCWMLILQNINMTVLVFICLVLCKYRRRFFGVSLLC